jgi:hypothetical protein
MSLYNEPLPFPFLEHGRQARRQDHLITTRSDPKRSIHSRPCDSARTRYGDPIVDQFRALGLLPIPLQLNPHLVPSDSLLVHTRSIHHNVFVWSEAPHGTLQVAKFVCGLRAPPEPP